MLGEAGEPRWTATDEGIVAHHPTGREDERLYPWQPGHVFPLAPQRPEAREG